MSGDKTCKRCKKPNLGWDMDFNKKTGKWKLENHRRTDGKWCNKDPERKVPRTRMIHCEFCTSDLGWLPTLEALELHQKVNHPTKLKKSKRVTLDDF